MVPVPRHPTATAALAALAMLLSAAICAGAAGASTGAGLIHATVTLDDGTAHTGFLRWKDEDAFWDDIFTARQHELPWVEHADRAQLASERRRNEYESRGLIHRLLWSMHHGDEDVQIRRAFACRYGDLAALRLTDDDEEPAVAVLRDGREVAVSGPSRDFRSDLVVYAEPDRAVELDWDDVREIRFGAAPADAKPYGERLFGSVACRDGAFEGSLQWDTSECTSRDVIDGDREDVPLPQVRRIARSRKGGSDVTLADGRVLNLDGTNDVGEGNRGVAIEVAGLGRVTVPWSRFLTADMRLAPATASGYADFALPRELAGTVTTADGRLLDGRLVYDLDEAYTSDLLHGTRDECAYQIPFANIATITPGEPGTCDVALRDGRHLVLGGDEDTGDGHAGLLVFRKGQDKPDYVSWSAVKRVTFAP